MATLSGGQIFSLLIIYFYYSVDNCIVVCMVFFLESLDSENRSLDIGTDWDPARVCIYR